MLTWTNSRETVCSLVGLVCLNPYSNGMLTWLQLIRFAAVKLMRLNPYSNGMLTWTDANGIISYDIVVLILILMECSLGSDTQGRLTCMNSLNPYSNGMLTWKHERRRTHG